MSRTILIVRKDTPSHHPIDQQLRERGFYLTFTTPDERAISGISQQSPHLVLLDVEKLADGWFKLCTRLRKNTIIPIIFLLPSTVGLSRVQALEMGADDCLNKPVRVEELSSLLIAHILKTKLYRPEPPSAIQGDTAVGITNISERPLTPTGIQQIGALCIDLESRRIQRSDVWHSLKPMEFALLLFFARNQNVTFTRAELFDAVWGKSSLKSSRTVDVHVRWLRQKIEDDPKAPKRITTVRGVGYRFNG